MSTDGEPEPIIINVPVEIDMECQESLREYLNEWIDEFKSALDLRTFIDRAEVHNVAVSFVDIRDGELGVEYTYDFSAYFGCDDHNVYDEKQEVITAIIDGRDIVFEPFVYPPEPTTFEEF